MKYLRIVLILSICSLMWMSFDQHSTSASTNKYSGTLHIYVTTTDDELTTNDQCSLREAIMVLNDQAAPDCGVINGESSIRIHLTPDVYTITLLGPPEDGNMSGDFDIDTNYTFSLLGQNATIQASTIAPAPPGQPLNPGQADFRIFDIRTGFDIFGISFYDLTFQNGAELTEGGLGGAIYIFTLGEFKGARFENVTFQNNVATQGGGLYSQADFFYLINSTFVNNYGGAFYSRFIEAISQITNSHFSNNTGTTTLLGDGEGYSTITGSTFDNNVADPVFASVGVHTATITNSTFTNNSGTALLFSETVESHITNVTIADNGGGINATTVFGWPRTITNTVISNNTVNCNAGIIFDEEVGNLEFPGTSCGFSGVLNNGTNDPLLQPLANNGGMTETRALGNGSPAINGTNASCPSILGGHPRDQRGYPRDINCDIGAYEDASPPSNDSSASPLVVDFGAEADGAEITYDQLLQGATLDASDPTVSCLGGGYNHSTWYTYTPQGEWYFTAGVDPDEVRNDVVVSIFSATDELTCFEEPLNVNLNNVGASVHVNAGETYMIMVAHNDPSEIPVANAWVDVTFALHNHNDSLVVINNSNADTYLTNSVLNDVSDAHHHLIYTNTPPANNNNLYVMGDWNGDGVETPGFFTAGAFRYANDLGVTSDWSEFIWLGNPASFAGIVAGRYSSKFDNDCVGRIDTNINPTTGNNRFSIRYWCDMSASGAVPLSAQFLGEPLANSQGFSGTHQWAAGDNDGDGLDELAVRRNTRITKTLLAPSEGAATYGAGSAQRWDNAAFNNPGNHGFDTGQFVMGDWNGDGISTFGVLYEDNILYYRDVFGFNPGPFAFISQDLSSLGLPAGSRSVLSWRSATGGSGVPAPAVPDTTAPEAVQVAELPAATNTPVPPTATDIPATSTPLPPTATEVPPTATIAPTSTPLAIQPTATAIPPTATDMPPTATDIPPTATDVPPTATIMPPTATPEPVRLPIVESMDDGALNWTATGSWQLTTEASYTVNGLGWQAGASADVSTLTFNRPINLGNVPFPNLRFQSSLQSTTSHAKLEISLDGTNWLPIAILSSTDGWAEQSINLSDYRSMTIWLRFSWYTTADGTDFWFVDEIDLRNHPFDDPTATPAEINPIPTEVDGTGNPTPIPPVGIPPTETPLPDATTISVGVPPTQ